MPDNEPTLLARAALKGARLLYRFAGMERELARLVYPNAFHLTQSIYIHIPKAAGNSVRQIVYGPYSEQLGAHVAARQYRNASPELFAKYFVFATVRHPLTRLRSAYHFLSNGGMHDADRRWAAKNLSAFKDFSEFVRAMENKEVRDRIMRYPHFMPQSWFVCDERGGLIVDFLVRVESFEADMRQVCRRLQIEYSDKRVNETVPRYQDKMTPDGEIERRCHDLYRQDYDVLGYDLSPAASGEAAGASKA